LFFFFEGGVAAALLNVANRKERESENKKERLWAGVSW
jgi:hypothetical protein